MDELVNIESGHLSVVILCDAPALSYVLGTCGHNARSSCHKCESTGEIISRRVSMTSRRMKARTDEGFRNRACPSHHDSRVEFCELERLRSFHFVSGIVLDRLHLVYLGVVRKVLQLLSNPQKKSIACLRPSKREALSMKLAELGDSMPREVNRRPRSLVMLPNWKGAEFRNCLLYLRYPCCIRRGSWLGN